MNVLIACEESQAVCKAFRANGHNAFSNDLQECSGGHPEWHIIADALTVINGGTFVTQSGEVVVIDKWHLAILHPPCTYTALCGNRWYFNSDLRMEGVGFCVKLWHLSIAACDMVCLEQPKTIMQRYIGKRSQTIHPWQFGHGETKETWLWLKGLRPLIPTNIVVGRENLIWKMPPSPDRGKLRSKTFPGIAQAMADQWG